MALPLTVTDVTELGDGWSLYPYEYTASIGYSCLTPELGFNHIKQYAIELMSCNGDKYILYTVSYDIVFGEFRFELPTNVPSFLDHVPYIGEIIDCCQFICGVLPKSDKPLKIVSNECCCLPLEDEDGCYGCYCELEKASIPYTAIWPMLVYPANRDPHIA